MTSKKPKKLIEKVEIKEEKDDLYPLTHYVDDRVELVKQIFSALKTKTIRNLAPESLKKSSINEIEELCLNELLGLSTKRLNSIINSTKCPSDTDSSNDSDVRNVEEHISLEEISSDSDTEKNKNAGKSGKSKKGSTNKQGDGVNKKGCSVLELLELQARARAIRSQLALEPIAKIEVESDDSSEAESNAEKQQQPSTIKRPTPTNDTVQKSTARSEKALNGCASTSSTRKCKRIKLKRNFRQQNRDDESDKDQQSDREQQDKIENDRKAAEKGNCENNPEPDRNDSERSPSPDVITILPSPETLFISDSSEEEENLQNHNNSHQTAPKNLVGSKETDELEQLETESLPKEPAEVEDGEIVDQEEPAEKIEKSQTVQDLNDLEDASKEDCEMTKSKSDDDVVEESAKLNSPKPDSSKSNSPEPGSPKPDENVEGTTTPTELLVGNETGDCEASNHNDDAISLGHDDLDDEMQEEPEEQKSADIVEEDHSGKPDVPNDQIEDDDIINLDDSSDDESPLNKSENQNQSWNYRWLNSDRVSKILATSRLGNRVRDKIKKSKREEEKKQQEEKEIIVPVEEKTFESQFEDGSIQQYAEILEREKSNV